MEKAVNSYETMFIVNPTISEDDVKATVEKFTGADCGKRNRRRGQ